MEKIEKFINCMKRWSNSLGEYIKNNCFFVILFFLFPFFLPIVLRAIWELGFVEYYRDIIDAVKLISLKNILLDIKTVIILTFTKEVLLEYKVLLSMELILYGLTGKNKKSFIILSVCVVTIASINRFVYQLRGAPIAINDLFSVSTAFDLIKCYTLNFNITFCILILIMIIFILVLLLKKEEQVKNIFLRILFIAIGILLFISVMNNLYFKNIKIWDLTRTYTEKGQILTFLKTIDDSNIRRPENYTEEEAKKILSYYKTTESSNDFPNILVVMNEGFSDLKDTYNLEIQENLNFLKSLKTNVISGTLHVSVLGGQTAVTEWEFLTGNSYAFLPKASQPYIQYIDGKKESLVSILTDLEYDTLSFHSYRSSGYNRKNVYNKFNFKESLFLEDMKNINCLSSDFPTDKCTYNEYFDFIEKNNNNKKRFDFVVTMQNHSPHGYDKKEKINYIEDEKINNYLNLINESDKALEELVVRLRTNKKKTILLFFGDHQPGFVANDFENFGDSELMQNYEVPFILWANYDIEEQENLNISSNYLSVLLSDVANIPKSEYLNFLSDIQEKIPIITSNGYVAEDGNKYNIKDKKSPYYKFINQYNIVQYYQMFDKEIE